jgi:transcription initiation protein SPT3
LNRLLHFLRWKDVRKNLNDEGGDRAGADVELAGGEDLGAVAGADGQAGGAADPKKAGTKKRVTVPWDVSSYFAEQVPAREDEDDEEEKEMNTATLERLKYADERTRNMSKEDYMHWSECRQASFTYRKGKRFREWVGMDAIVGTKPNDDVMDILGFLTFEMVQTLTEEALKVKEDEDRYKKARGAAGEEGANGGAGGASANGDTLRKRKREIGLFDGPEEEREPVSPWQIQEAFRRLQKPSAKQILGSRIVRKAPVSTLKLI